jgi:hypothetical protein
MDSREVEAHLTEGTLVEVVMDKMMDLMDDVDNSRPDMGIHLELGMEVWGAEALVENAMKAVNQSQLLHTLLEEMVVECKVLPDTDEGRIHELVDSEHKSSSVPHHPVGCVNRTT